VYQQLAVQPAPGYAILLSQVYLDAIMHIRDFILVGAMILEIISN
jgi:hypothetical protein